MRMRQAWLAIVWAMCGTVLFGAVGCGSKAEPPAAGAPAAPIVVNFKAPQECVQTFLESVRKGDDKLAEACLTDLARQKTQEFNLQVAPPGSNTASFEVGEVKMVGDKTTEEGAYVASKWTDVGDDGKPRTDEIMWIVTHDPNGWRIVGMGVQVFADLEPVYLNFEDPQDMLHKQQMVENEMARRAGVLPQGAPGATASTPGAPGTEGALPPGAVPPGIAAPGTVPPSNVPGTVGTPVVGTIPPQGVSTGVAPENTQPAQAQLPATTPNTQLK